MRVSPCRARHCPRGSGADMAFWVGSFDPDLSPEPAFVSTGEGYGAAQASSETDLLNRFILLKPKASQGESSEAKTPSQ